MSATEYPSFVVRSSTGPTLPWRARSSRRLETVALALAICLPVPIAAVLGLSLPLPNFVERVAAALIPWADPVTLEPGELERGAGGSIVPSAADVRPVSVALGAVAATPSVNRPSGGAAAGTATPLAATPAIRPAATDGGATVAPNSVPTPGAEPAREPAALPTPEATPTKAGTGLPGVTETVRVPVVPAPPLPDPIPAVPTVIVPTLPAPLPAPVQERVDGVAAVAAAPVGTVGGVVGGIVPAPGGTTPPPLPLPGLGK